MDTALTKEGGHLAEHQLEQDTRSAYILYLVYLVSFFLHLPARIPPLGIIRFDFLLVGIICFLILGAKATKGTRLDQASYYLVAIFVYSIIVIPFAEWPGSVINNGLVTFIKGAIFYFFTINLIVSERRLKVFVAIFIACNLIRVFEPLFLNITTGYLGSRTHLGGGDFAGRLSGAPSDTINANGLAFVIASILPFLHYVYAPISKRTWFIYLALLVPLLFYAMGLTLSRSGILALGIIAFGVFLKSNRKPLLICIGIVGIIGIWSVLNDTQKDRYLSIVSEDAQQSASASGRIEGWTTDFKVAMNRPIFGHGLGTSREANWNVAGKDQISHILWAEIWQEIGIIGLILFVLYLKTIIRNFIDAGRVIRENLSTSHFLYRCNQAMQVWLLMNLLFSLASYGLKSYEWYLFGSLSVVLLTLAQRRTASYNDDNTELSSEKIHNRKYALASRLKNRGKLG